MKVEINDNERNFAVTMIEKKLAEIPIEIHHCRVNEYKTFLKEQQAMLEGLLKKLQ